MHAADSAARVDGAGVQGHQEPSRVPIEPYAIKVPDALAVVLDELVERVSRRTGERPKDVRRGLEIAVLSRGVALLRGEEGMR